MSQEIYLKMLDELTKSSKTFLGNDVSVADEMSEDFLEVINSYNINKWKSNIDGKVKTVTDLLIELGKANEDFDRQKCIESIAMLRCAVADIESAFSNAMDSMEELIISIRDKNK